MHRLLAGMAVLAGLLAACGDSGSDDAGTPSECTRFVLFDDADWDFHEAVDYPEDGVLVGDPGLDWYSEFEKVEPALDGSAEGTSLRISGHAVGLTEFRREFISDATLEEREGADGLTLVSPANEVEPSVLVRSVSDDYTLMLLSYGLELDELTEVAAATRPVCEKAWLDAGGRVLDCMPTEPDCVVPE